MLKFNNARIWGLVVWLHNPCFSQQTILNFGASHSNTYMSGSFFLVAEENYTAIHYSSPRLLINVYSSPTVTLTRYENFENYNIWEFRLSNGFYPNHIRQIRWKPEFVCLKKPENFLYLPILLVTAIQIQLFLTIYFFQPLIMERLTDKTQ